MKAFRSLMAGHHLRRGLDLGRYPAIWKTRSSACGKAQDGNKHRPRRKRRCSLRPASNCLLGMAVLAVCAMESKGVTVQWDPNSETDLAGYKLYYGQTNNAATVVNTTSTSVTLTNLTAGKTYYFYATAY